MSLRVFCVSLPKCGTHLLRSCLLRLGLNHAAFEVTAERELAVQATYLAHQAGEPQRWYWGNAASAVDPEVIEAGFQGLLRALDSLPDGTFLNGHYAYEPRLADALRERGIAVIIMSRDPRAALLSMADYVLDRGEPRELALRLPAERPALFDALVAGTQHVRSLQENFDAYRAWLDDAGTLAIRFEDLVGPKGGGSLGRQAVTVGQVAQHVGLQPSPTTVARAMHGTFDSASPTFSQGHSERWRRELPGEVLLHVAEQAAEALVTWGAPPSSVEDDHRETSAVLADWMGALATSNGSANDEAGELRAENARKQAIIDEWVGRAVELQAEAWRQLTTEHRLDAALADGEKRLALIRRQQSTIDALARERDMAYADSDARLAVIHRLQAALKDAAEARDRLEKESDERLALIHRQQGALLRLAAPPDQVG